MKPFLIFNSRNIHKNPLWVYLWEYNERMPEEKEHQAEPTVVQVVYQVPIEDAPIPPERLSALEWKTGILLIILCGLWAFLWYVFWGDEPETTPINTPTDVTFRSSDI